MFSLLYYGYAFLSGFVPFLAVLYLFWRRSKPGITASYIIWPIVLAVYVLCVFQVTGAGTVYDALDYRFRGLADRVNLIPFSREINPFGYILNVFMFMPFGFLVPLIWKKASRLGSVALAGLLFSLLIELSQLLCWRGTDVDDLIMNTLGACIGFLVYRIWVLCANDRFQQDRNIAELPCFVLAIYFGRCFLYNGLGLIQLWYG